MINPGMDHKNIFGFNIKDFLENRRKHLRKTGALMLAFVFAVQVLLLGPEPVLATRLAGGEGYQATLYDKSNGLPTSDANAIVQTNDGFIWIGSYAGLIRYDGTEFYRLDASQGIASVVSLFVDDRDRVWIGTNDNGIAYYEKGKIVFPENQEVLKSSSIRGIEQDAAGDILVATTTGIGYVDAEDQVHALDDPQLNGEYVCELQRDPQGIVYGETLDGDIFCIENKRVALYYSAENLHLGVINAIYPDPDHTGYVYLGTAESEVYYGNIVTGLKDVRRYEVNPHVNINAIRPVEEKVFLCADNGIGFFDENRGYNVMDNLPMDNSVDDMIVDYEGNLWFVSSRQGVMKITENQFTDISNAAGLPPLVVNSTCMYGDDLYIGTDSGLYILDSHYRQVTNDLTEMLTEVRIRCIRSDSKGNLWLSTYSDNGLVCVDPQGAITCFNEENGMNTNRIRLTMELPDGRIAVGTSGGLHIIEDGQVTEIYDAESGVTNTEILTIGTPMDDSGRILLGSDGDGIYVLDGNAVSRLGREDGLPSEVILRIREDPERNLNWIITSNAIAYLKDGKITTIEHFPYSNNFDLYYDDNGGIWVLSSNGIYVVPAEELLADPEDMEYTFFDTDNGLPTITTANSRSCIEEDGTLYISGSTGVASVNVNDSYADYHEIKLAVPFVEVDDELYPVEDGKVTIPANAKRVVIDAYALTYTLNNPVISTQLKGFDDEPQLTTKKEMSPSVYTNLDGGTYTYRYAVINTLTGAVEEETDVVITKTMAFYENTWFLILMSAAAVVVIGLLIWLSFRGRLKRAEKKAEENRKRISQLSRTFAKCIDIKDTYTNGHSFRVAKYTKWIAEKMGYPEARVEEFYNIALLHDIGKIGIPDKILNKPERLDDEEFVIMKSHAQKGYEILSDFREIEPELAYGAGYHHERFDGKGYPNGVGGDDIPDVAKIIAVADTFDAMYSTRPYRKKLPLETVVNEIKSISGTQLDPKVVEAFLALYEEGVFDNE